MNEILCSFPLFFMKCPGASRYTVFFSKKERLCIEKLQKGPSVLKELFSKLKTVFNLKSENQVTFSIFQTIVSCLSAAIFKGTPKNTIWEAVKNLIGVIGQWRDRTILHERQLYTGTIPDKLKLCTNKTPPNFIARTWRGSKHNSKIFI